MVEVMLDSARCDPYNPSAIAGWSSLVARWAHNPKVGGSNPSPATRTHTTPDESGKGHKSRGLKEPLELYPASHFSRPARQNCLRPLPSLSERLFPGARFGSWASMRRTVSSWVKTHRGERLVVSDVSGSLRIQPCSRSDFVSINASAEDHLDLPRGCQTCESRSRNELKPDP